MTENRSQYRFATSLGIGALFPWSLKIQERISRMSSRYSLHVEEINIHVQGVSFEKDSKKTEPVTPSSDKNEA